MEITTTKERRPAHIFILNYRDTDADPDPINCQAIILASASASFHLSATVYLHLAIYTILCTHYARLSLSSNIFLLIISWIRYIV